MKELTNEVTISCIVSGDVFATILVPSLTRNKSVGAWCDRNIMDTIDVTYRWNKVPPKDWVNVDDYVDYVEV